MHLGLFRARGREGGCRALLKFLYLSVFSPKIRGKLGVSLKGDIGDV